MMESVWAMMSGENAKACALDCVNLVWSIVATCLRFKLKLAMVFKCPAVEHWIKQSGWGGGNWTPLQPCLFPFVLDFIIIYADELNSLSSTVSGVQSHPLSLYLKLRFSSRTCFPVQLLSTLRSYALNLWQKLGSVHGFMCSSSDLIPSSSAITIMVVCILICSQKWNVQKLHVLQSDFLRR